MNVSKYQPVGEKSTADDRETAASEAGRHLDGSAVFADNALNL